MLKRNNVWEYGEGLLQACISSTYNKRHIYPPPLLYSYNYWAKDLLEPIGLIINNFPVLHDCEGSVSAIGRNIIPTAINDKAIVMHACFYAIVLTWF